MTELDDEFGDWSKPVSRGDLLRSLAYVSTAINALGIVVTNIRLGDDAATTAALLKFIEESRDIQKLIDEFSGKKPDGNEPR